MYVTINSNEIIFSIKKMQENKEKINTDNGFTMIEHGLYNWVIRTKDLGKPEMRIVHAIIRQTNGYHQKIAPMSYRYFEALTGIDHRNMGPYLKNLLKKKIIFRFEGAKDKYGKPAYSYSINKKRCYYQNDSDKEYDSNEEHNSPDIKPMPKPVVKTMSNKDINKKLKKPIQDIIKKLNNYKKN